MDPEDTPKYTEQEHTRAVLTGHTEQLASIIRTMTFVESQSNDAEERWDSLHNLVLESHEFYHRAANGLASE